MLRSLCSIALAFFMVVLLLTGVVEAQEALTNLRVEGTDQAGRKAAEGFAFPDGTKKVTVKVEHDLAGSETVGVSVVALSVPAFAAKKTVTGKGTVAFDVTGEAVYAGIAASSARAADSAAQTVALAVRGTGMHDYLLSAKGNLNTILGAAAILKGLSLDATYSGQVRALEEAATTAVGRIDTALDVPPAKTDEKKARAVEAQESLPALQQAAKAVSERLADASGLPLPKTGDDTRTPLDVTISRDGQPAMSTAILIGTGSLVPEPTATSPAVSAGSGGGNTRSTATAVGQSGGSGGDSGAGGTGQGSTAGGTGSGSGTGSSSSSSGAGSGVTRDSGSPALATSASGTDARSQAQAPLGAVAPDTAMAGASDSSEAAAVAAQPMATWTVAANEADALAQLPPGGGGAPDRGAGADAGSAAPNLAILAVGALLLVGAAIWLRRRM